MVSEKNDAQHLHADGRRRAPGGSNQEAVPGVTAWHPRVALAASDTMNRFCVVRSQASNP